MDCPWNKANKEIGFKSKGTMIFEEEKEERD